MQFKYCVISAVSIINKIVITWRNKHKYNFSWLSWLTSHTPLTANKKEIKSLTL